jgi:hypothetical protein
MEVGLAYESVPGCRGRPERVDSLRRRERVCDSFGKGGLGSKRERGWVSAPGDDPYASERKKVRSVTARWRV